MFKNNFETIVLNPVFQKEFWKIVKYKNSDSLKERDYQRILVETFRKVYSQFFIDMFSDLPTSNNGLGYDLKLYTFENIYDIEVKTDVKPSLRESQETRYNELLGTSILTYVILLVETKTKTFKCFFDLVSFREYLKNKKG